MHNYRRLAAILTAAAAAILTTSLTTAAHAATLPYISGTVTDSSGIPVVGAIVTVSGDSVDSGITGTDGTFRFQASPSTSTSLLVMEAPGVKSCAGLTVPQLNICNAENALATPPDGLGMELVAGPFTFQGDYDAGAVTMPTMKPSTITPVDAKGNPVAGVSMAEFDACYGDEANCYETTVGSAAHASTGTPAEPGLNPPLALITFATGFSCGCTDTSSASSPISLDLPTDLDPAAFNDGTVFTYTDAAGSKHAYSFDQVHRVSSTQLVLTMDDVTLPAPAAPTDVRASVGDGSAVLTWGTPAGPVSSYTVTVSPGVGPQTVAAGTTTLHLTDLTDGTTYTATVHASNATGDSPESGPVTFVPEVPTPPATVPGRVGRPTLKLRGSTFTLMWKAPATGGSPIVRYLVTGTRKATVNGRTTTVTFKNVRPGTYRFAVTAVNAVGDGHASPAVSIKVKRKR